MTRGSHPPDRPRRNARYCRLLAALTITALAVTTASCSSFSSDRRLVVLDENHVRNGPHAVANLVRNNAHQGVRLHDVARLRLTAKGGAVLVRSVDVPDGWELMEPTTFPVTVGPTAAVELSVRLLDRGLRGLRGGQLKLHTDAPGHETTVIPLGGFEQIDVGGPQEPTLQDIVTVFGWSIDVAGGAPTLYDRGRRVLRGRELNIRTFAPIDPDKPVTVTVLAAFVRVGTGAPLAWRPAAAPEHALRPLLTLAATDTQTLLPSLAAGGPASADFSPAGDFALVIDGQDSDDARNSTTLDARQGCRAQCGHHVRIYPVVAASGRTVRSDLLVAVDYFPPAPGSGLTSGEKGNGDFQDAVLLVHNARAAG